MAYDEALAARAKECLSHRDDLSERKMFGGVCLMLGGNMCCGVSKKGMLMLRVGPDQYEEALQLPHSKLMDFTGRPMRGFVYVEPDGYATDEDLREWIAMAERFAGSLPPK